MVVTENLSSSHPNSNEERFLKWVWMMRWCAERNLSPADPRTWEKAEKEHQKKESKKK